jgi:hypothetical protein
MFFDRTGPSPISDLLHFNGVRLQRFILLNPNYPATASQISSVPTSVVTLAPARSFHTRSSTRSASNGNSRPTVPWQQTTWEHGASINSALST